ncbi:hypothetical protein CkaCkLH20_03392 [Colletotrichum karsti]|uniref:Transcription factor domain-containing protein n=1 Tax=Colletotrichum karsti TaxID=1095194 RepID=A0A9P6IAY1_9PEZI|nr:uncharacterized protein CkaCkLH20_03392 [Colletotrichum karsti]KAF9879159.1 hypothetical protein CkaCkLH20_03392 [Colletotrichum karsti]
MMADYLDLVYVLVPVVHRPTFRHDLANNRDVTDRDFFALLMSLVAITVGLLPSRFRVYRAVDPEAGIRFETRTAFISCCTELATRHRDARYWDHINLRKWAVSYVLSVACFQTGQANRSRMFDIEFMQLAKLLGLHRISDYEGLNCIETQLRKKAFWLLFYAWAHTKVQSGRSEHLTYFNSKDIREVNFEALMPLAVDDEQIFETRVIPPVPPLVSPGTPGGAQEPPVTLASAFILHSRVFHKGLQEAMANTGCECELRRGPAVRLARLRDLLQEMRYMLDDAPGPMRQWAASTESFEAAAAAPVATPRYDAGDSQPAGSSSYDSPAAATAAVDQQGRASEHSKIVHGQSEIMRANIHVTHLWLQSILLEQVDVVLQESAIGPAAAMGAEDVAAALKANWAEREDICRQMLHLLHSIPYIYLEPNGLYLTYKVRDVAVTLLNCPFDAHERPARRAAEYMRDFTRALSRLDRSEIVNTNSLKSWVDVDREMAIHRSAFGQPLRPWKHCLEKNAASNLETRSSPGMSTPTEFKSFGALPAELRFQIWTSALSTSPYVWTAVAKEGTEPLATRRVAPVPTRHHIILACRESQEAMKKIRDLKRRDAYLSNATTPARAPGAFELGELARFRHGAVPRSLFPMIGDPSELMTQGRPDSETLIVQWAGSDARRAPQGDDGGSEYRVVYFLRALGYEETEMSHDMWDTAGFRGLRLVPLGDPPPRPRRVLGHAFL